jgi:hypothetical protein
MGLIWYSFKIKTVFGRQFSREVIFPLRQFLEPDHGEAAKYMVGRGGTLSPFLKGNRGGQRDQALILTTALHDVTRNIKPALGMYLPEEPFRSCLKKPNLFPGCPFFF